MKPIVYCKDDAERILDFYVANKPALEVPLKPDAPISYPVRDPVAAPSSLATELDRAHVIATLEAWKGLSEKLHVGVFTVPKEKALNFSQKPKRAKTAASSACNYSRRALEGKEFTEDRIDWKVSTVHWCDEQEVVVVWYYDVAEAESREVSEEDRTTAIEEGEVG